MDISEHLRRIKTRAQGAIEDLEEGEVVTASKRMSGILEDVQAIEVILGVEGEEDEDDADDSDPHGL